MLKQICLKKTLCNVDNLSENEKKRLALLTKIKEMVSCDYKYGDIAKTLGISTRTVIRYKDCNPQERCHMKRPSRTKEIEPYKNDIITLIENGYHASGIANQLVKQGCKLGLSTIHRYAKKIADEYSIDITKNRKGPEVNEIKQIRKFLATSVTIKKQDVIKILWMNQIPEAVDISMIYDQYPIIRKVKACIDDFREIFIHKNMIYLYLFIEHYKNSEFSPLVSFAKGLERDLDAVENAVASQLSNGFVEGMNNRTKVIKRVMYGRCGLELLSAKIMLPYMSKKNG